MWVYIHMSGHFALNLGWKLHSLITNFLILVRSCICLNKVSSPSWYQLSQNMSCRTRRCRYHRHLTRTQRITIGMWNIEALLRIGIQSNRPHQLWYKHRPRAFRPCARQCLRTYLNIQNMYFECHEDIWDDISFFGMWIYIFRACSSCTFYHTLHVCVQTECTSSLW